MAATDKLVVVLGMTASGKSAVAMQIAQAHNGEIICADSRTIYKGLDIGTAKPSKADQKAVKHHLLDVVRPDQTFNVAQFQKLANQAIAEIQKRGKLPILVGGTGLYIDAVIYNYDFAKDSTPAKQPLRPNTLVLGCQLLDEELKRRIAQRVDQMLADGLEDEARQASQQYGWDNEAMKGIGYREWRPYFANQQNLATTREQIIKNTWQYARRQRTWFRRNNADIQWIDPRHTS